jgi:hypothetical protein
LGEGGISESKECHPSESDVHVAVIQRHRSAAAAAAAAAAAVVRLPPCMGGGGGEGEREGGWE